MGVLNLAKLRKMGAFVKRTGKPGRPCNGFGARNRLHVQVAIEVQRLIDADKERPYGRNMRAFKLVAEQSGMTVQSVQTIWKCANRKRVSPRRKSPISRSEIKLRLGVAEIEGWFALLPSDVATILARLSLGDLLHLLHSEGIDRCTSAEFCAAVRRDLSPPI